MASVVVAAVEGGGDAGEVLGPAEEEVAGELLVGGGEVAGVEVVGGGVPLGFSVVVGAGGEVARGGGHRGSRDLAARSRNCPMASSRVPPGSPASTWARSEGRKSCSFIRWQSSRPPDWL